VTPGAGSILTQGHNLNNFGRGPLDDAILLPFLRKAKDKTTRDKTQEEWIWLITFIHMSWS